MELNLYIISYDTKTSYYTNKKIIAKNVIDIEKYLKEKHGKNFLSLDRIELDSKNIQIIGAEKIITNN